MRERAGYACEYCGVTETDSGGELTVDHFQPQARGGGDDLDNLLYCCFRCNTYKADYWADQPGAQLLWNPRVEPLGTHLLVLIDGSLYPITSVGEYTLWRLRLNRPALIASRLRRQGKTEQQQFLTRHRELIALMERLYQQQSELLDEHHSLLEEQRRLLQILVDRGD